MDGWKRKGDEKGMGGKGRGEIDLVKWR